MKLKKDEVLVLRRNGEGNKSGHNPDFTYPDKGYVEAKDWKDSEECGNGLHGWTLGFEEYTDTCLQGNFVVLLVNKKDGYVELGDKVKFRKGKVILQTPDVEKAHALMLEHYPTMKLHWHTANQKDYSTANQRDNSTANQGHSSTANQKDYSTANQGSNSTANQKDYSTANQGSNSTANQRYHSTANQGYKSTANQRDNSTANQRDNSTANQGHSSTANQGHSSTANQGYNSTANQWYHSTANQRYHSTANQGHSSTANQGSKSTATVHGTDHIYRNSSDLGAVIMFYNEKMVIHKAKANTTFYIEDMKIKHTYTYTPDNITKLKDHEVFVFGSNLAGDHAGGSAKLAQEKFGAKEGVGEGFTGQAYAFPTLDENKQQLSLEDLKVSAEKLFKCATENTRTIFFLTKVGCGIAGFSEEQIKPLFELMPANVIKPKDW